MKRLRRYPRREPSVTRNDFWPYFGQALFLPPGSRYLAGGYWFVTTTWA